MFKDLTLLPFKGQQKPVCVKQKQIKTFFGTFTVDVQEEQPEQNIVQLCRRCGRKLKDTQSIELGFGKTCYKKYLDELPKPKPLFDIKKTS